MKSRVPFIKPSFPSVDEMSEDYRQIVDSNWFTNFGPFEKAFAKEVGNYIGKEYIAITFSSGTAALIASMLAILGKGDTTKYIIMPSFTFVAGADAIVLCGYRPLFVDIENEGLHMNISRARAALLQYGERVAGILFCNAFGVGTNNIEAWETLSKEFNKPLIVDSAAGFGSLYNDTKKVGSAADCEIFSFHATKSFAIGEGGAVITSNSELAKNLLSIQNFGFDKNINTTQLGFNGKLQEINAAIGLRQLKRFSTVLEGRRRIFARYKAQLDPERYLFQKNAENASLCFATVIVKDTHSRDKKITALHEAGIDAKIYYNPSIHKQGYFKETEIFESLSATNIIDESVISLPVYDALSDKDVNLIIRIMNCQD